MTVYSNVAVVTTTEQREVVGQLLTRRAEGEPALLSTCQAFAGDRLWVSSVTETVHLFVRIPSSAVCKRKCAARNRRQ